MKGSWKTSLLGALTILAALAGAGVTYLKTGSLPDIAVLGASITAGIGLIKARDRDVSSEQEKEAGTAVK